MQELGVCLAETSKVKSHFTSLTLLWCFLRAALNKQTPNCPHPSVKRASKNNTVNCVGVKALLSTTVEYIHDINNL